VATGFVGFPAFTAALKAVYETGNVRVRLMNGTHTPTDAQEFWSAISANELSTANGYTAGGKAVTATVAFNDTTNLYTITFPQESWTADGALSAYVAVYVNDTGNAATSRILYQNQFTNQPTTATDAAFTVNQSTITVDFPD
jgi:hypothetical protein